MCAVTYAYHLTQSHAFLDGNKRLAAAVTEAFLETNGFDIASSELSREQVEERVREKVKAKN